MTLLEYSAIPVEYRYRTDMAAALVAGLSGSFLLISLHGLFAVIVGVVSVLAVIYGTMGLIADARGLICYAGKRLVVADEAIQEVDEEGRIRWTIRSAEIDFVKPEIGPPVNPFSGQYGWRVEYWRFLLKDGRSIRVPVWLLPDRGKRFRQRYESLLGFTNRCGGFPQNRVTT